MDEWLITLQRILQQQGSLYYQPKQCSWKREIPQIDHTFALLDPPKVYNSLTPESPWVCLDIAWIWCKFYIIATESVLGESGATPHGLKVSCCSLQQRISNRLHCRFSKDSHENMVLKLYLNFILILKRNQFFENTPFPSNLLYHICFFKEIKWTWEFLILTTFQASPLGVDSVLLLPRHLGGRYAWAHDEYRDDLGPNHWVCLPTWMVVF